MKSIGLIGGLTYVSTIEYYRHLNEISNQRLGGNETAEIIVYSVNFGEIKKLTENEGWKNISVIIILKYNVQVTLMNTRIDRDDLNTMEGRLKSCNPFYLKSELKKFPGHTRNFFRGK